MGENLSGDDIYVDFERIKNRKRYVLLCKSQLSFIQANDYLLFGN